MKKLISNTTFGSYLRIKNIHDYEYRYLRDNFDCFLLQKLEIWMFIPCKLVDGVWVVLEEPLPFDYMDEEYKIWCESKERCFFEGIEYVEAKKENEYSFLRITQVSSINYPVFWDGVIIEDLVKYKPKLTATAKKIIGI
jgi:hypothetical protein